MPDAVLVGANLAALVAAHELVAAGREVVLLTDGRPPGGHFAGVLADGVRFDVGMVTLERPDPAASSAPPPAPSPALTGYDPDRRYDWTRFAAVVDRWQQDRAELRRTPTPEVSVDGARGPDHLMSDRLDVLAGADVPRPGLAPDDPRHASGKTAAAAYDVLPYREASLANHGTDVHTRLVEPFLTGVLGTAADQLLARYHRAAWLPLYWPDTVAAASHGSATGVPEHPFWTTAGGSVADLVTGLLRELTGARGLTLDEGPVHGLRRRAGAFEVRTADGSWTHPAPVVGLPTGRARTLVGLPEVPRGPVVDVTVLCCLVRAAAVTRPVGCLLVADGGTVTHRVTDQDVQAGRDVAWRRVTVEAAAAGAAFAGAGGDLPRRMVEELVGLLGLPTARSGPGGVGHPDVRVLRTVRAPGALAVPTAASVRQDRSTRLDLLEAGVQPTGALLGTGLNAFADQVVQGLGLARRLG